MPDFETSLETTRATRSTRPAVLIALLALGLVAAAIPFTASFDHWSMPLLTVIAVFTVVADLTAVGTGHRLSVSGSFLGLILAAVVLGPAPAAVLGFVAIAVGWLRSREAGHYLLNNLANYAFFPMLAGVFFHVTTSLVAARPTALAYYLLVFATFVVALAVNFLLSLIHI